MTNGDRWGNVDILDSVEESSYVSLEVEYGMTLTHTGSAFVGAVAAFSERDQVLLVDDSGNRRAFRAHDGAFTHDGVRVALRARRAPGSPTRRFTPSGSIDAGLTRARVARAGRIWVEGIHDADLIEKIWGDDLRTDGVVVEPLHGADDLPAAVEAFRPGSMRRLGVLLDHLVEGSKESRIAQRVDRSDVLICGHPYVDIWQAIRPQTIGIASWPEVPRSEPWKEGVLRRLGVDLDSGRFWGNVLGTITSYRDVETPLVNAVEQLIDFVTVGG